jgi:hypothetical protein
MTSYTQWHREYHQAPNLILYTLNDYFNGSWTVNTDDYRSFGLGGERIFKVPYTLSIDYFGLTMRKGFPQGQGMRLDELSILLKYRFFYSSGIQRFILEPASGLFAAGNLRSQSLQNVVHRVMSVPEVEMKYATRFLPTVIFGGAIDYGFSDTVFHSTEFSLTARVHYTIRPGYDSRMETGVFTALKGAAGDLFRLDFFNRYCRAYTSDPVLKSVSDVEEGWRWRYIVMVGNFYISNEFGIRSGFSAGAIGLTFTKPLLNHVFTKDDFTFDCGILPGKSGWIAGIKAHPWSDGRFNLKADFVFLAPEDIEYPAFRLNQQYLTFGGEFMLFLLNPHFTISPFFSAGGGIFRGMRYSGVVDTIIEEYSSPAVSTEIGIYIGGLVPHRILPANVVYGISFSDRFTLPFHKVSRKTDAGTIHFIVPFNCIPVKISATIDY